MIKGFIAVEELARRLGDFVLIDCELEPAYQRGHLPGARHAPCRYWKRGGTDEGLWAIDDPRELADLTRSWGLDSDSQLVAYDHSGGLNACRLAWTLERFGFSSVQVLDGGLRAWLKSGHPLSWHTPEGRESNFEFSEPTLNTLCSLEDFRSQRTIEDFLWDDRSEAEWNRGRIPGARHLQWSELLEEDHTLITIDSIKEKLHSIGLDSQDRVTIYCQGGIRAAHSYWVLRGLSNLEVRLFDGSWAEYGDSGLPVEF